MIKTKKKNERGSTKDDLKRGKKENKNSMLREKKRGGGGQNETRIKIRRPDKKADENVKFPIKGKRKKKKEKITKTIATCVSTTCDEGNQR